MSSTAQDSWFASAIGRATDPDGIAGYQCVDVPKDYFEKLTGKSWKEGWPGAGNAKDMLGTANTDFWDVVYNTQDPNLLPAYGDVIVFAGTEPDGNEVNPYGHIGVNRSATPDGCDMVDQDGFEQRAMQDDFLKWDNYGTGPVLGWLKPKFITDDSQPNPNQRLVGAGGVIERTSPVIASDNKTGRAFAQGTLLTFDGYQHGDMVNGTDVWFRGAFSKTWFSASAFDDNSPHDLNDLTPPPAPATQLDQLLLPYQRTTGTNGASLRVSADKNAREVKHWGPDLILDFRGYVVGTDPYGDGRNKWFVGKYSDTYAWQGAFIDSDVHDLPDLTSQLQHATVPAPSTGTPAYDFALDFPTLTREDGVVITVKKVPAANSNFQKGNPTAKHGTAVIHQFGTPNVDTQKSTDAQFTKDGTYVSAYWSVEGREVHQYVSLADRAYHAGPVGNDYVGIETSPLQDPETIATVRALLIALKAKEGQLSTLMLHKNVPQCSTNCGALIDLSKYDTAINPPVPALTPAPEVTPAPAPFPAPVPVAPPTLTTPTIPGSDQGSTVDKAQVLSLIQRLLVWLTELLGIHK